MRIAQGLSRVELGGFSLSQSRASALHVVPRDADQGPDRLAPLSVGGGRLRDLVATPLGVGQTQLLGLQVALGQLKCRLGMPNRLLKRRILQFHQGLPPFHKIARLDADMQDEAANAGPNLGFRALPTGRTSSSRAPMD